MKNHLFQNVYFLSFPTSCWPNVYCTAAIKNQFFISLPLWKKISFSTILINVQMCFFNDKVSSSLWRDETHRHLFLSWVLILPFVWIILSLSCSSNKFRYLNKLWMLGHNLSEPLALEAWHKLYVTWDSHYTFDFGQVRYTSQHFNGCIKHIVQKTSTELLQSTKSFLSPLDFGEKSKDLQSEEPE